jgi:tetratricopeptide (TPR) repeat protein
MISKLHWLTSLGLLIPSLAAAQAPSSTPESQLTEPQQGAQVLPRVAAGPQQSSNSQKMYEDIEIMRRILNRKLGLWPGLIALNTSCASCHVVSGNHIKNSEGKLVDIFGSNGRIRVPMDQANTAPTSEVAIADFDGDGLLDMFVTNDHQVHDAHASLGVPTDVEGVYLKGQGAVYTVTLPPPPRQRLLATKFTSSKPLTDWERARQSVRGDQPKQENSKPESHETGIFAELENSGHLGLTEAILRVLAENGHHFSNLAPDEKITVAITFRESGRSANQIQAGGAQTDNPLSAWGNKPMQEYPTTWENQNLRGGGLGFSGGGGLSGGGNSSKVIDPGAGGLGIGGLGPPVPEGGKVSGGGSAGNQTPASVRDFELLGDRLFKQGKYLEAIKAFQRALNLNPSAKQSAALYRRIAQADLAMDDAAAAKKALAMADELLKENVDPSQKSSSGVGKGASSSSLPSKLIISAPKKLLDQVGAGKISYADFRRQATIDYLGLSSKSTN